MANEPSFLQRAFQCSFMQLFYLEISATAEDRTLIYAGGSRSQKGGCDRRKGAFCVAPGSRNLPFTYTPGN